MTIKRQNQLLDEFISLINKNEFYNAHESIEAIWFPRRFENSDEVKLLKGFINAAVSFELSKRRRASSSQKVWKTYLKYRPLLKELDSEFIKKYYLISKCLEDKKLLL